MQYILTILWLLVVDQAATRMTDAWVLERSWSLRTSRQQHQRFWTFAVWMESSKDRDSLSSSSSNLDVSILSNEIPHDSAEVEEALPDFLSSPVLRQVYPHLMEYKKLNGHVNIPLGSSAGRQCQTLRRLQLQQKLTDQEVELLSQLQFRFTSLDDVYYQVPFEEMFQRLLDYEQQHPGTGFQIPKKYPSDPELGAWVTGIRRLAPNLTADQNEESESTPPPTGRIHPDHVERLNAIGFTWKSDRKCGSKFMQFYRELHQRIQDETQKQTRDVLGNDEDAHRENARLQVLQDPSVQTWIAAQRETFYRGTMSETRQHYMNSLVGDESWKDKPQEGEIN
jgi:hypothetical protein